MDRCSCCNSNITDDLYVHCSVCKKIFKTSCTKLSRSDITKINTNCGLSWSCKDCVSLGGVLADLKSAVLALQEEIRVLKDSPSKSSTATNSLFETEHIIQEVIERERRRNNIIVFGIEEAQCESAEQQRVLDRSTITSVLTAMNVQVGEFKSMRLGKFDPTKINSKRPIKVSLPSTEEIPKIFKKLHLLKSIARFSNIIISSDKTPFQTKLYKSVKEELDGRSSRGETNLKIKYIKGLPTIIDSSN